MMITASVSKALNEQVTSELNASHKYLAMAACFRKMGFMIFAKRFLQQSEEERTHALKIVKFLEDVGATVKFDSIAKPKPDYPNVKAIVKAALESEEEVTKQIHELVALADKEKDYTTRSFLQWFVDEQVEEVSSMTELLQWVTMAGESNLLLVENRIAQAMSA